MALGQDELRVAHQRAEDRQAGALHAGVHEAPWRALATLLRITPAIVTRGS